jgi:hypothetical protein
MQDYFKSNVISDIYITVYACFGNGIPCKQTGWPGRKKCDCALSEYGLVNVKHEN